MATVRSATPATGLVVNGVTLGEPATISLGGHIVAYLYEDAALPEGEVAGGVFTPDPDPAPIP